MRVFLFPSPSPSSDLEYGRRNTVGTRTRTRLDIYVLIRYIRLYIRKTPMILANFFVSESARTRARNLGYPRGLLKRYGTIDDKSALFFQKKEQKIFNCFKLRCRFTAGGPLSIFVTKKLALIFPMKIC